MIKKDDRCTREDEEFAHVLSANESNIQIMIRRKTCMTSDKGLYILYIDLNHINIYRPIAICYR